MRMVFNSRNTMKGPVCLAVILLLALTGTGIAVGTDLDGSGVVDGNDYAILA